MVEVAIGKLIDIEKEWDSRDPKKWAVGDFHLLHAEFLFSKKKSA